MNTQNWEEAARRLIAAHQEDKALEVLRAHHDSKVWIVEDSSGTKIEYDAATYTREAAAQDYVDEGDWGTSYRTRWHTIYVQPGYELGNIFARDDERCERTTHRVTVKAEAPLCDEHHAEHLFRAPVEIVGGIAENPGVRAHGGGVICDECCMHCGCLRQIDTWAQNPATGEQGLHAVRYEPGFYAEALAVYKRAQLDELTAESQEMGLYEERDEP